MKLVISALLVSLCLSVAGSASAQSSCRPTTLPLPGAPTSPGTPGFQGLVDEAGRPVLPIPFLLFLGDVVLVDGDQTLADKETCLYYGLGQIDPSTWSDVLHFDNNPLVPGQATLFSDCDPNNPNDPCLPPYEIDFKVVYTGTAQLVNPVFIPESATGPTQYFPLPGVPIVYIVDSDPIETVSHPGCPTGGKFQFQLYEDCHATKVDSTGVLQTINCQTVDPVTGCPAFLLDGTIAFAPGWVRLHEGAATAPVSDLLHFFGNHFVSFCSDPPDVAGEVPEAADVGIRPIPPGDTDPVVDLIEDVNPTVYGCGTAVFQIFSDPPEPTPATRPSWGKVKAIYH